MGSRGGAPGPPRVQGPQRGWQWANGIDGIGSDRRVGQGSRVGDCPVLYVVVSL